MTQYILSDLGITQAQLSLALPVLNPLYLGFIPDPENFDSITFLGTSDDPSAPIPDSQLIIDTYDACVLEIQQQELALKNETLTVSNKITTTDQSFCFITDPVVNSQVQIHTGGICPTVFLDGNSQENVVPVANDEFIDLVESLNVNKYNMIGQPNEKLYVSPSGSDWNGVFNFAAKDDTTTNVELIDIIGVLLSVNKDLIRRVKALEAAVSSQPVLT